MMFVAKYAPAKSIRQMSEETIKSATVSLMTGYIFNRNVNLRF